MSDTKAGRIYKIVSTQSDHVYVGSTFNTVRDRFHCHKGDYSKWLKGKHGEISIYPLFKQRNEVCDRPHLEAYESLWISKLACVNKANPFRIMKLYQKEYREANKDKIKKYREDNKEALNEKKRANYQANKISISEKNREKVNCFCGGKVNRINKSRHLKTKKHINWQSSQ
ncbi:GIY-YIG nuclease superfamily [Phytophthora cactorum]|nr:GIY-YIG nuclease superfamily [Phytophthora cactorum]KAF1786061.1 GIY-YIG nuclease superfamily [Phytophthora cactorum]KAF1787312.1 GIY-YIG nuclease superfamily [Phytophthora cactorum]